jgi:dTDP-glucose 4,6-dehydratase
MKILVAGGSGFLGSSIIKSILHNYPKYSIVNFDRKHLSGGASRLAEVLNDHRYQEISGDILDRNQMEKIIKEELVDIIVNCATYTQASLKDELTKPAIDCHIEGTWNMLELTKKYDLSMVQVSTVEVYGSTPADKILQHSALLPTNVYAASKGGGDLLCQAYAKSYGTKVKIIRATNVFGPYQHPREYIPTTILALANERYVELEGDGLQSNDWLYIDDFTRAVDAVLHKGEAGGVYLVGSGQVKTYLGIVDQLLELLEKKRNLIRYLPELPHTVKRYDVDNASVKGLGWEALYDFDMSLGHMVRWYQAHAEWVNSIQEIT